MARSIVALAACFAVGGAWVSPAVHRMSRARTAVSMGPPAGVKTCGETMADFNKRYQRPIVPIWRSPLNDLIEVSHLSIVREGFKYDMLFGYGFVQNFDFLFQQYPMKEESAKMREAALSSLGIDVDQAMADFSTVTAWLEGKSEADVFAAASAAEGPVGEALALGKGGSYMQSRPSNMALVHMMESVGADVTDATSEKWATALELNNVLIMKDLNLYKQTKDKMEQGMQMVKALEIREKKRQAEALEEKAKKAQAAADEAAKSAPAAETA
jgi:hypothetical protein